MEEFDFNEVPDQRPGKHEDAVATSYAKGVVVAFFVIISFVVGVFMGGMGTAGVDVMPEARLIGKDSLPPQQIEDVDFAAFWEIWSLVKERYVDGPVSDIDLFHGAISGMVASLGDPYSVFLDPELAQQFNQELEGKFEGIGAEIALKKSQLTVVAPLADTPADRAGLKPGDKILAIDDIDTAGMYLGEAVGRIRGERGTEVRLLIYREGVAEPKEISILRDTIVVESVRLSFREAHGKRVTVMKLSHFNDMTDQGFNDAVREVLLESPDGLILDMRNNPGGFFETAVEVAGEWIPRSVIVVEQFSETDSRNYTSNGNARLADVPTVVLVNMGSASASEIVAGALQDYGKAYIVGESTFGKGSVQDYMEFTDGSALKLTIARWLTPNGRSINEEGIDPDEIVELTNEDFDNDRDPQMERALEAIAFPETMVRDDSGEAG